MRYDPEHVAQMIVDASESDATPANAATSQNLDARWREGDG